MAMLPGRQAGAFVGLVKGNPIPAVKVSGPLRVSDIPPDAWPNEGRRDDARAEPERTSARQAAARRAAYARLGVAAGGTSPPPSIRSNTKSSRACGPAGEERTPARRHAADRPDLWNTGRRGARWKVEAEHRRGHAAMAATSRNGLIVATRSGHHVQLDEPELVVKAIRDTLAAARK